MSEELKNENPNEQPIDDLSQMLLDKGKIVINQIQIGDTFNLQVEPTHRKNKLEKVTDFLSNTSRIVQNGTKIGGTLVALTSPIWYPKLKQKVQKEIIRLKNPNSPLLLEYQTSKEILEDTREDDGTLILNYQNKINETPLWNFVCEITDNKVNSNTFEFTLPKDHEFSTFFLRYLQKENTVMDYSEKKSIENSTQEIVFRLKKNIDGDLSFSILRMIAIRDSDNSQSLKPDIIQNN